MMIGWFHARSCLAPLHACKFKGKERPLAETGGYCVLRHLRLRQNFCAIYVTEEGKCVDTHKDYISGCGHTEHCLFVSALLQKGGVAEIRHGPELSRPKKKVKKSMKAKRSERLKSMLRAPKKEVCVRSNLDPGAELQRQDVSKLLPGSVSEPTQRPILHSCSDGAEELCMARTQKASRCKNQRSIGSFCKKHYDEAQSQKYCMKLFDSLPAGEAMSAWERSQLELAVAQSMEENEELQRKEALSAGRLDRRMADLGLKRVPVARFGACQFEAICYSAELPMSPMALRLAAVEYLKPLGALFADRLEGKFRGQFQAYCQYMKAPDSWGDDMTCLACSHLLRRPVDIITDSGDDSNFVVSMTPPDIISKDIWGPKVTISLMMDKHYDATELA